MCLGIALRRPDAVLAKGVHADHEWQVIHNGRGYRCGYVKVDPGHPWHGRDYDEIDADVHGGLSFSAGDEPCPLDGADDGHWVGFDCAHAGDAPDPMLAGTSRMFDACDVGFGVIRDQAYAEAECRSLCEQAEESTRRVIVAISG